MELNAIKTKPKKRKKQSAFVVISRGFQLSTVTEACVALGGVEGVRWDALVFQMVEGRGGLWGTTCRQNEGVGAATKGEDERGGVHAAQARPGPSQGLALCSSPWCRDGWRDGWMDVQRWQMNAGG